MQNLPTPVLGEITALTITTTDLEQSLAFYQMLGFSELFRSNWPFPWIQISDGVLLIMLRKDEKPYMALTYYVKDINKVTAGLEQKGIQFEMKPGKTDPVKRYLMRSPDGLAISLVNVTEGFRQPPGPGMLQMDHKDYFNPEKYVNKTSGLYGELAHPVADLEKSLAFWKLLGFTALSTFTSPYPWAIISDGLSVVGLHQTDEFNYPAITFFAADMQAKIASLRKAGLKNIKEKDAANAVIITPEQQHIFLYSLGDNNGQAKPEIKTNMLETKRLWLIEVTPDVYHQLFTTRSEEEIMEFMGLNTSEEFRIEKEKYTGGMTTYRTSFKRFFLKVKDTGKVIGSTGFHNWYAMHMRAELGYALNDEASKNKGYMKEAVAAVIKYGFEQMGLNRIEAFVGPGNIPSILLVKGYGFTEEGRLREHFFKEGELEDAICFALLKSEYNL